MNLPLVCVVIPTFRRPAILTETLRSVLRQDYPQDRYEGIVVDDCDCRHDFLCTLQAR